jgi:spore germination cell wall hydrolase CwlJ-like protein
MSQGGILLLIAALAAHGQHLKAEQAAEQAANRAANQVESTCLAQALYYEARGEGERGEEAVAEVILHRARSGHHPDTICGVVHEPHQFSFLQDGSTRRKLDPEAWKAANSLAARIIRGEIVTDMTRSATFYHQADVRPGWADAFVRTAQVGNHIFYRLKSQKS